MELRVDDAGSFKPGENLVALACTGTVLALDALDNLRKHFGCQRSLIVHVRDAVVLVKVEVAQACRFIYLEPGLVGPAHRLAVAVHDAGGTYPLKNEEVRIALRQVAERLQVHGSIEKLGLNLTHICLAH